MIKRLKLKLSKNDGSSMVESAIVFPIIILAAMFTVYMTINYYSECSMRAKMHEELRDKASAKTGKTELMVNEAGKPDKFRAKAENTKLKYGEGGSALSPYVSANATESYKGGMLTIKSRVERTYTARSYVIDEIKGLLLTQW